MSSFSCKILFDYLELKFYFFTWYELSNIQVTIRYKIEILYELVDVFKEYATLNPNLCK